MLSSSDFCEYLTNLIRVSIYNYDYNGIYINQYLCEIQQENPIKQDPTFEKMLIGKANLDFPVLHFEFESAIYGIIKTKNDGIFILGPACLITNTSFTANKIAKKHNLDLKQPFRISKCDIKKFCSACSMIFHYFNDIKLNWNEIITLNAFNNILQENIQKQLDKVFYSYQEKGKTHNPYAQEQREQESIRSGDLESLKKSFQETYTGEVGTLAKDPLRNVKNLGITLIALSSRSAIEGGVSPEIAYSLSDAYVLQIEDCLQPDEVISIIQQAEIYYTKLVQQCHINSGKNVLVLNCKQEIHKRLHHRITVKELAKILNTTPNYLTQVFKKEENQTLTKYINSQKIKFAKQRLRYTDDDYDTIAYSFGFSSQSHFTYVFKNVTGITPKKYRDKFTFVKNQ